MFNPFSSILESTNPHDHQNSGLTHLIEIGEAHDISSHPEIDQSDLIRVLSKLEGVSDELTIGKLKKMSRLKSNLETSDSKDPAITPLRTPPLPGNVRRESMNYYNRRLSIGGKSGLPQDPPGPTKLKSRNSFNEKRLSFPQPNSEVLDTPITQTNVNNCNSVDALESSLISSESTTLEAESLLKRQAASDSLTISVSQTSSSPFSIPPTSPPSQSIISPSPSSSPPIIRSKSKHFLEYCVVGIDPMVLSGLSPLVVSPTQPAVLFDIFPPTSSPTPPTSDSSTLVVSTTSDSDTSTINLDSRIDQKGNVGPSEPSDEIGVVQCEAENEEALRTFTIESLADYCFPEGLFIKVFTSAEQALQFKLQPSASTPSSKASFIRVSSSPSNNPSSVNYQDSYHVLQFSDISGNPSYACCLTTLEVLPVLPSDPILRALQSQRQVAAIRIQGAIRRWLWEIRRKLIQMSMKRARSQLRQSPRGSLASLSQPHRPSFTTSFFSSNSSSHGSLSSQSNSSSLSIPSPSSFDETQGDQRKGFFSRMFTSSSSSATTSSSSSPSLPISTITHTSSISSSPLPPPSPSSSRTVSLSSDHDLVRDNSDELNPISLSSSISSPATTTKSTFTFFSSSSSSSSSTSSSISSSTISSTPPPASTTASSSFSSFFRGSQSPSPTSSLDLPTHPSSPPMFFPTPFHPPPPYSSFSTLSTSPTPALSSPTSSSSVPSSPSSDPPPSTNTNTNTHSPSLSLTHPPSMSIVTTIPSFLPHKSMTETSSSPNPHSSFDPKSDEELSPEPTSEIHLDHSPLHIQADHIPPPTPVPAPPLPVRKTSRVMRRNSLARRSLLAHQQGLLSEEEMKHIMSQAQMIQDWEDQSESEGEEKDEGVGIEKSKNRKPFSSSVHTRRSSSHHSHDVDLVKDTLSLSLPLSSSPSNVVEDELDLNRLHRILKHSEEEDLHIVHTPSLPFHPPIPSEETTTIPSSSLLSSQLKSLAISSSSSSSSIEQHHFINDNESDEEEEEEEEEEEDEITDLNEVVHNISSFDENRARADSALQKSDQNESPSIATPFSEQQQQQQFTSAFSSSSSSSAISSFSSGSNQTPSPIPLTHDAYLESLLNMTLPPSNSSPTTPPQSSVMDININYFSTLPLYLVTQRCYCLLSSQPNHSLLFKLLEVISEKESFSKFTEQKIDISIPSQTPVPIPNDSKEHLFPHPDPRPDPDPHPERSPIIDLPSNLDEPSQTFDSSPPEVTSSSSSSSFVHDSKQSPLHQPQLILRSRRKNSLLCIPPSESTRSIQTSPSSSSLTSISLENSIANSDSKNEPEASSIHSSLILKITNVTSTQQLHSSSLSSSLSSYSHLVDPRDDDYQLRRKNRHSFLEYMQYLPLPHTPSSVSSSVSSSFKSSPLITSQPFFTVSFPSFIKSFRLETHPSSLKEWASAVLFATLPAKTILRVLSLLLLERSLIIFSSSYGLTTALSFAFKDLLSPFSWEGIFVPLVPREALEVLGAPVPFIVGCSTGPNGWGQVEISPSAAVLDVDALFFDIVNIVPSSTTLNNTDSGEKLCSGQFQLTREEQQAEEEALRLRRRDRHLTLPHCDRFNGEDELSNPESDPRSRDLMRRIESQSQELRFKSKRKTFNLSSVDSISPTQKQNKSLSSILMSASTSKSISPINMSSSLRNRLASSSRNSISISERGLGGTTSLKHASRQLSSYLFGMTRKERSIVQSLLSSVHQYVSFYCQDAFLSPEMWRNYGVWNHATGDFEFRTDWYLEPLKLRLRQQEVICQSQLFVSLLEKHKKEYEQTQRERLFIQDWLSFRIHLLKHPISEGSRGGGSREGE